MAELISTGAYFNHCHMSSQLQATVHSNSMKTCKLHARWVKVQLALKCFGAPLGILWYTTTMAPAPFHRMVSQGC